MSLCIHSGRSAGTGCPCAGAAGVQEDRLEAPVAEDVLHLPQAPLGQLVMAHVTLHSNTQKWPPDGFLPLTFPSSMSTCLSSLYLGTRQPPPARPLPTSAPACRPPSPPCSHSPGRAPGPPSSVHPGPWPPRTWHTASSASASPAWWINSLARSWLPAYPVSWQRLQ